MAEGLREARDVWADEVEATMLAARALVAISARSVTAVEDVVTPPQLRVLVMIASRGPLNLGAVARGLGVHPSNATRACDRLVSAGLVDRRDDPADRRNLQLQLTEDGRRLVDERDGPAPARDRRGARAHARAAAHRAGPRARHLRRGGRRDRERAPVGRRVDDGGAAGLGTGPGARILATVQVTVRGRPGSALRDGLSARRARGTADGVSRPGSGGRRRRGR